ncbi:MAG: hypothetical protein HY897_10090 [Deltaproteobacteria bacterium]|nr:hypothetical protein [Deltaproteobacteria bacterium]
MKRNLIVTVVCPDRPGIVDCLTGIICRFGGNWEESRMARLGGDFAGIVKVSVSEGNAEALAHALIDETKGEMSVSIKSTAGKKDGTPAGSSTCTVRASGADHEGIVHNVTHYLAAAGANVVSMETGVTHAPVTGSPLFHMEAGVALPPGLRIDEVKANLERICRDQGVEVEIAPGRF